MAPSTKAERYSGWWGFRPHSPLRRFWVRIFPSPRINNSVPPDGPKQRLVWRNEPSWCLKQRNRNMTSFLLEMRFKTARRTAHARHAHTPRAAEKVGPRDPGQEPIRPCPGLQCLVLRRGRRQQGMAAHEWWPQAMSCPGKEVDSGRFGSGRSMNQRFWQSWETSCDRPTLKNVQTHQTEQTRASLQEPTLSSLDFTEFVRSPTTQRVSSPQKWCFVTFPAPAQCTPQPAAHIEHPPAPARILFYPFSWNTNHV